MNERMSFSRIKNKVPIPNLLDIQLQSFKDFLQEDVPPTSRRKHGLHQVFLYMFPISDPKGLFSLEYVEYSLGVPKYSIEECKDRDMSFSVPLKAVLSLLSYEKDGDTKRFKEKITNEVYLGDIPYMTETGTFVINGAERVIVSQLHRSPGVFFGQESSVTDQKQLKGRIIPFKGAWLEFIITVRNVIYVSIDRRRKFPATTFLRALGYSKNIDILNIFFDKEEVSVTGKHKESLLNRVLSEAIVNKESGEIVVDSGEVLTEEKIARIIELGVKNITVVKGEDVAGSIVHSTLVSDPTRSEEDALIFIYTQMRAGEPPNVETARQFFTKLFFDPKRYDLGAVGRYKINQKLYRNQDEKATILNTKDIVETVKYLVRVFEGDPTYILDDIDHLGNRRARTVGELLTSQFEAAFMRMSRTVKERLSIRDNETLTPKDLINARAVTSVIGSFFGSSQLSQFLDETNPLASLTHKRRISALGPGGLSRERAGFEVRDVHHSHYGRFCPIETPEGPNIGLISSLCTYAKFNEYGFLESPYFVVKSGRVTEEIVYLSADDEDHYAIAQANAPLTPKRTFANPLVSCRQKGDFPFLPPDKVDLMDVSPTQLVSVAAGLIPFLEHDDANRALMGSNMQRQAVPLLMPEAPIVGTGLEGTAAYDSGVMAIAKHAGVVERVYADRIVVRRKGKAQDDDEYAEFPEFDTYILRKFKRSNQDTCFNQKPIVDAGNKVEKGMVLADGPATQKGELALGRNVLIAFMPWRGYNFEDAIILNERLVKEDVFTSVHIEEFQLEVRDTKRGAEEITREIPNVSEDALRNLDESGIIRVGAEVEQGDILVGKVTPRGETELTPEERLLRAIFGEKASDVKDSSLKVPPGIKGIVLDTKSFSRKDRSKNARKRDKQVIENMQEEIGRQIAVVKKLRDKKLIELLKGAELCEFRSPETNEVLIKEGTKFSADSLKKVDFTRLISSQDIVADKRLNRKIKELLHIANRRIIELEDRLEKEIDKIVRGDELKPGVLQLVKVFIAKKRKISVGDKMAGRHGNKGVIAKIVPEEDMPVLPNGNTIDVILNPLGVPSRMNVGQVLETHAGFAAKKLGATVETAVFDGAKYGDITDLLKRADLPLNGKMRLLDGRTGEYFDEEITIGQMYLMKLAHLVDDKIHARSIGPYSLVTQQPLGGKSQFGGQRFGEMEVWALEAYGAAYTLQELLTVKSDDVIGRSRIYESIVKGENTPRPGVPESFNVLVKEIQALCLDMRIIEEES
ncbi:MAG: DNA-directed RNA polymerase subunit beta [Candidatus Raymondbacteria bacterium RifOxyA12_full_50_37]|uniref:DNA-directed RNA polymerase subunit beta n=1 Tax=Candidatus Raymondbacteria bacterium RIFOXYD12_FULL_49_13 TaxID=1817890 RepID=A0A1F7FDD3_UNCRA|nr:MAG: DNA-directed RNA polymerase subunit beta [Candidatus Raymondbacteria bacterium RifOxyA12_full_50_37]OGJ94049.1 MAG: DNA-directed RNA polymerase subunit beta [Candidatus Raymondbacteria bacterium RIFOXYA2_FULL_49_16]OGJ96874.1 MAG: DNA-directed RNA polymerase subunit beta [Candidatus Raymondbacteria bacterium RIFOXYC2_FULL_50_21]OGK00944.1 MAG: DNA-directed RNA polymerase subunit beta [Candidatus Raymondbacteria bacterium RifOxyB12_full_50_8]OGK04601.1 MAG: DNA-directed RNA polymerase su